MSLLSYSAIVRERKTKYCARSWYFQQKNCKHLCYGLWNLKGFITSPSTNYAHTTEVCNSYVIKGTGNEHKGVVNVPRIAHNLFSSSWFKRIKTETDLRHPIILKAKFGANFVTWLYRRKMSKLEKLKSRNLTEWRVLYCWENSGYLL